MRGVSIMKTVCGMRQLCKTILFMSKVESLDI